MKMGIGTTLVAFLVMWGIGAVGQAIAADVPGCAVLSPGIVCCQSALNCPPSTAPIPNYTSGTSRVTITEDVPPPPRCTVVVKEGERTLVEVSMTDCTRLKVELRKP